MKLERIYPIASMQLPEDNDLTTLVEMFTKHGESPLAILVPGDVVSDETNGEVLPFDHVLDVPCFYCSGLEFTTAVNFASFGEFAKWEHGRLVATSL
jgi:hypothetical protein